MKSFKKFLSLALVLVMILSVLPTAAFAAETDAFVYNGTESITYQGITFKRQQGGVYDGIPLFDANPDHLDAYLDVYMDYIGLDGMVRIGLEKRNDYTLVDHYTISDSYADAELAGKTITWENKNAGKVIPGSPQFNESVQGYSTNFPAQIGVGQTWNAALVEQEGRVVGTEKLYGSGSLGYDGSYLSNANQMVSTALSDMRVNPLSGRIDESYSEDAHLASTMVNAMAAGVTGHDQEKSDGGFWQMAFVDTDPRINLAYGVAGLSIALDSLSAIKYAKVTTRRNAEGLSEGFDIQGEFPCFGNNDDRVDHLGVDLVYFFSEELKKLPVYKNARPTLSLLTITSNVMYGKKTGATPDGRAKGVAFAPGANPMHGRDKSGAIASLASVAKLRYRDSQDGISNTFSIVPKSLGPTEEERIENLVTMLDGYFTKGAHHLNVNVLNRAMLEDAMEHPENYPQLTIRVSGYAVNFTKLSREHQLEVISRSFHERM